MITHRIPKSWQNLQTSVCEILQECGFDATVEQFIQTARSNVALDVCAIEMVHGRPMLLVFECKWWKRKVTQGAIHAFRSVLSDCGADRGYIISKNGYQPSAFHASNYTNIQLLTWEEFLEEFEIAWLENHFVPTVTKKFDWLLELMEPSSPTWLKKPSRQQNSKFIELQHRYSALAVLAMNLSRYSSANPTPPLPLQNFLPGPLCAHLPTEIVTALGYYELLREMLKMEKKAAAEFAKFAIRLS